MRWPSAIIAGDSEADALRSTAGVEPQPVSKPDAMASECDSADGNRSIRCSLRGHGLLQTGLKVGKRTTTMPRTGAMKALRIRWRRQSEITLRTSRRASAWVRLNATPSAIGAAWRLCKGRIARTGETVARWRRRNREPAFAGSACPVHAGLKIRLSGSSCAAIQRSIFASSTSSGTEPSFSTSAWNSRMSNFGPSSASRRLRAVP